jgi:hypothetical protein
MSALKPEELDRILALQLSVAWAGEALSEPPRLRWWRTDLVDEAGGGDLFTRLLPRTHRWAALATVREAARRVDEAARKKLGDPDAALTLYHLGFERDEQLDERLTHHKREATPPEEVFGEYFTVASVFDKAIFASFLDGLATAKFEVVPSGRMLKGKRPDSDVTLCEQLAAALAPLADAYPMPFLAVAR